MAKGFQVPAMCRIAYIKGVFEKTLPRGVQEGTPAYNCVILVPKKSEKACAAIMEAYNAEFEAIRKAGFKGKTPEALDRKNNCLVDGDKYADANDGMEDFRGTWRLSCRMNYRPMCVDKEGLTITNGEMIPGLEAEQVSPEVLQSGDYVLVNLSFWSKFNASYQNIGCNVHAIKRMGEGALIGNVPDITDFIDDSEYDSFD